MSRSAIEFATTGLFTQSRWFLPTLHPSTQSVCGKSESIGTLNLKEVEAFIGAYAVSFTNQSANRVELLGLSFNRFLLGIVCDKPYELIFILGQEGQTVSGESSTLRMRSSVERMARERRELAMIARMKSEEIFNPSGRSKIFSMVV
jgi:hypothetical protein